MQQREPSNVRRRTAVPVTAPAQAGRPSQNGTMRPEPARASSNTKSNTKRTETSRDRLQAARQGAQDDDFDMMSDDDEFDEEALAILQAAEAAELSARDQKAGSDNKQKTKPQGPSRGLAAAAKPLAAGAVSTSRSGGTQASSNGSAFKAKGAAQVIDLDDSEEDEDDDEEVALMLLSSEGPQEVAHGHSADRQATRIDRPRRNQPIEID